MLWAASKDIKNQTKIKAIFYFPLIFLKKKTNCEEEEGRAQTWCLY
jgi:hypothetical protein